MARTDTSLTGDHPARGQGQQELDPEGKWAVGDIHQEETISTKNEYSIRCSHYMKILCTTL